MSDILNLARAVAEELREYKAELLYFPEFELRDLDDLRIVPEFELRDLDDLRIVVVPAGTQYKTLSRAAREELPKVQIGILKRCREDALDEMLCFAEKLGLGFLNRKLAGGTCVSVIYNPIYSPEHLRERGQFTSVIELVFKVLKS